MDTTDVVFLRDQEGCDIFAVFPGLASSVVDARLMTCYAHIGQHSGAHPGYCAECEEVTDRVEYADLFNELSRAGYNLYVVRKDRMGDDSYADARRSQVNL